MVKVHAIVRAFSVGSSAISESLEYLRWQQGCHMWPLYPHSLKLRTSAQHIGAHAKQSPPRRDQSLLVSL